MADARSELLTLSIWTLYDNPSDLPGAFVVRRFEVRADGPHPTEDAWASKDIEELRWMMIEKGLTCLPRNTNDDPKIVECWL